MSILKSPKPMPSPFVRATTLDEHACGKVISAFSEQKAMAEAKIAGQHFAPTHMVWRLGADRQPVQFEAPKR